MLIHQFSFQIAGSSDVEEVLRFQDATYLADLGHVPSRSAGPHAKYFVAHDRSGKLVAAFRLLRPESRPFDFEHCLDLAALLGDKARPALVGRLCTDPQVRGVRRSIPIHAGLLRLALSYARADNVSDLLLYTYENLVTFYRAARFADTGMIFTHPEWGPVRLMRLPLASNTQMQSFSRAPSR